MTGGGALPFGLTARLTVGLAVARAIVSVMVPPFPHPPGRESRNRNIAPLPCEILDPDQSGIGVGEARHPHFE
jgi:hypothetical protein